MTREHPRIEQLRQYFERRDDVVMAFVFGSRSTEKHAGISDWDIACYLKTRWNPSEQQEHYYQQESEIWSDLAALLQTDDVDLVILNRAPATIAAAAINGSPLVIKDRRLYLEFMLGVTREAEDFRQTALEYAETYWRSTSMSEEDRDILNRRVVFLDSELSDAPKFHTLTRAEYEKDSSRRRDVERWVENLVNAAIDICKTILASEKRPIPSSYRDALRNAPLLLDWPPESAELLASWADLRNILAHEYLDLRWNRIEGFIREAPVCLRDLTEGVRKRIEQ